jgi:5'-methylthioadenosine phosphorylase
VSSDKVAEIGVIGGTGVYDPAMLEDCREVKVHTPYGAPSDLITLGTIKGRKVAFLPRHGRGHTIPPHMINARANIWALKELGVKQIVSSSAVGSLRSDFKPGEFVLTDQFIDRTKGRPDTFYDGGQVAHVSSAEPVCPQLREYFFDFAKKINLHIHDKGTYVCIQGPRFGTRAESRVFRQWGCDIVGMTLYPEIILAREAEMCYVTISMVTDLDVWEDNPVNATDVVAVMRQNADSFKKLVMGALPGMPKKRTCECGSALKNALM